MEIICTRPHCPRPKNMMPALDDRDKLGSVEQVYCTSCRMPLIIGGRYIPSSLLGQGGFGAAFLASDRFHPRLKKCVVKQFQPAGNLGTQALEKAQKLFIQEAEVLADLGRECPGIPELYASFPLNVPNPLTEKNDRFFYLVQEYIDGQTLEKKLETKNAPFSEAEVRNILGDLLQILKYIHSIGVIHRDIKPSNIIQDNGDKIYLIDFGSVKQVANIKAVSTQIYTPGYASPEQQTGGAVSPSSDLYALAATCVSLLTNRTPEDLFNPTSKVWRWQPYAPGVSNDLANILNTMLQPNPLDRFENAGEILSKLNVSTLPAPPLTVQQTAPPVQAPPPQVLAPPKPTIPLLKIITSAGLIGFTGSLVSIAATNLIPSVGIVIALVIMAAVGLSISYQLLDRKDLLILLAIFTFLIAIIPKLRGTLTLPNIFILALFTGLGAIMVAVLFRLIYNFISKVL
ncbi:MAG: Serine/threonine-protein kinase F [Chroococcopsis gigantea SAG 12.99]|jgi:serine/threonine protein kinase|nr:serine/threonine protein kinase [Chlorogloea purpurea SAG 13.99]MDV3001573.1 Serine/threonine-protein kinase F [Chroococcopsis gigantea SAG 12.99]